MNPKTIELTTSQIAELRSSSPGSVRGGEGRFRFSAEVVIPGYSDSIARHYQINCRGLPAGAEFRNFGLLIAFDEPTELMIYDDEWRLQAGLKKAIEAFGPVILRNAHLPEARRSEGQRNIFESLAFHLDRGQHMENRYSLFIRDPFDPAQRAPRKSSTLILSYNATQLQAMKEGRPVSAAKPRYNIFAKENVEALFDRIMLCQRWSAPAGTGELCILDNRTVYHASYYRRDKGYPIGVRYLY